MKALPLVLLGIRTNVKPDINCTSAELVYGMTLRLSGEFFHCSDDQQLDPISYVDHHATAPATSCQITSSELTLHE